MAESNSLFMRRPPRRGRLVLMLAGSLLVHGGFVLIAAIWPQTQSWKIEEPPVELDLADKLGDPEVRELVVADNQPTPPPDQPTPPPEDTPAPEDTPPPVEDPEMAQPDETPPPEKPKPKVAPPKPQGTPPPANAKRGPVAVDGVVGGNPNGTKATGTPGGTKVSSNVGWRCPHPPYPAQARASKIAGSTAVHIQTDSSGNVSSVSITKSAGSAILDSSTKNYVQMNWHGPPNASHDTTFVYQSP